MDMSSERLRPPMRSSGRKEKTEKKTKKTGKPFSVGINVGTHCHQVIAEHKVGDNVFAKWTDCRMYAGTILTQNPNGSYEVLFYDGFKKSVQPINVKTMPLSVQKEYAVAGMLPHPATRPPQKHLQEKRTPDEYKRTYTFSRSDKKADETTEPMPSTSRYSPDSSSCSSTVSMKLTEKTLIEKLKYPESQHSSTEVLGTPLVKRGKGDGPAVKRSLNIEGDRRKRGGGEKRVRKRLHSTMKSTKEGKRSSLEGPGPKIRKISSNRPKPSRYDDSTDEDETLAQMLITKTVSSIPRQLHQPKPNKPTQSVTDLPLDLYSAVPLEHKNSFQTEPELFSCPFENCNKSFRKTSLVEYHVKYYHTEDGSVVQQLPARNRRRKTISVCSTDSEMSFSGRQGGRKRRRESSIPVLYQPAELPVDISTTGDEGLVQEFSEVETRTTTTDDHVDPSITLSMDYSTSEPGPAMDVLSTDELVNCICQINEENGLMIQCDVCLCWQHALCMELTEETLPAKYICYICTNPPGVREQSKYSYDQDWLKQGTMARFNFLPDDPYRAPKAQIMQATHSLMGDLHGVNRVLRSVNCKLHANKDKNHPEVKFWIKNWDKEVKPDKLSTKIKIEPLTDHEISVIDKDQTTMPPKHEVKTEENEKDTMLGDLHPESLIKQEIPPDTISSAHASSSSLSSYGEGIKPSVSGLSLASQDSVFAPTIAVKKQPFVNCEQNLLDHISGLQDNVDNRLDLIEEQIAALESADDNGNGGNHHDDVLHDVPRVKKAIHQILNDLVKVKRMALYH